MILYVLLVASVAVSQIGVVVLVVVDIVVLVVVLVHVVVVAVVVFLLLLSSFLPAMKKRYVWFRTNGSYKNWYGKFYISKTIFWGNFYK